MSRARFALVLAPILLMLSACGINSIPTKEEAAKAAWANVQTDLQRRNDLIGNLVETVRGRHGGVRLGRPAEDISLFDVVRVTEENFAMAECFENDATECPLVDSCALNSALREALNAFFDVLMRHSIADLVAERPNMRGLLGIELPAQPQALAG